jgi:hypothetical protein
MSRPVRPSEEIIARIRALVDTTSVSEAGRRLRLSDATIARLVAGLPVAEGTLVLAEQRLPEAEAA